MNLLLLLSAILSALTGAAGSSRAIAAPSVAACAVAAARADAVQTSVGARRPNPGRPMSAASIDGVGLALQPTVARFLDRPLE